MPHPASPAASAHGGSALREALERLAAGEPLPNLDALDPALRGALEGLRSAIQRRDERRPPAPAPGESCHACLAGIDRLAAIRQLGSDLAERITAELAARIRAAAPGAQLRRIGRSTLEFTLAAAPAAARALLERLHAGLEARITLDGQAYDLPVAIGFARAEPGEQVDDALTEAAEHALARAQAEHRTVVEFDEAARARRFDQLALMRELRAAIDTDDVHLCYQPKLDARTGAITACEALIRWRHPERGMVPPDQFIGLAEQTGEIGHITERVIRRALADQATMRAAGVPMEIAVNVSGGLFCDGRFADWALERIAGATDPIALEITETAVIKDPAQAIARMKAFAEAGVRIAIDDYGSGLSSLHYLKQLPAHELKIDRAFISGLTSSHRDPLIVRSTIDLAHALDMRVTAEGVDSPAAQALLTVMGCDTIQGYQVSPALPLGAYIAFVQAHDPQVGRGSAAALGARLQARR